MSSLRRGNAISWEEVRDARPEAMAKDDLFQTLFQAEMGAFCVLLFFFRLLRCGRSFSCCSRLLLLLS